jgi:hypothetical protein
MTDISDHTAERNHHGKLFQVSHIETALADAGVLEIFYLGAAANPAIHMTGSVAADGKGQVQVFEDTTVSSNGTGLTPANKNRTSAETLVTASSFFHTPTITGDGTSIGGPSLLPGVSDGKKILGGGEAGASEESILDGTKNYLIRYTNTSGGAVDVVMSLSFYEE